MPIKITCSLSNLMGRFQKKSIVNELAAELTDSFKDVMTTIQNKAKYDAPTKRISSNVEMEVTSIQHSNITLSLVGKLFVRLDEGHAPEARAYEYGSGIHSTKGPKMKYSIDAINAPNLVFWWKNGNKWFVGPHVDHPGVAASPYLRPAVEANLPNIRDMFHRGSVSAVHRYFRS